MNNIKSYFSYSKSQRNGILFFVDFSSEESNIEKHNTISVIISLKPNYSSNFFKDQSDAHINSNNQLKKYGGNRNFNHFIAYFQKITNNFSHLSNEINFNLNQKNNKSQPT